MSDDAPPTNRAARSGSTGIGALDLAVLGAGASILVGLAWISGLPYLAVRGGLPSPVRLAVVDAVHIYVGVGALVLVAAKTGRAGLRLRVKGEPELAPRRRWLSWSLVATYTGVAVTGGLALLPLPGGARADLVDGHLITAVWATAPTTAHLVLYRRRAAAVLRRPVPARDRLPAPDRPLLRRSGAGDRSSGHRWRLMALGLACALVPLAAVAAVPRAASPLAQAGAGAEWLPDGPRVFLDRLQLAPGGRSLAAGGAGLFVAPVSPGLPTGGAASGPGRWSRVGPFDDDNLVLGLQLPSRGPVAAWVGTTEGLWSAPRLAGPYRQVPFPSAAVHAIAVAPSDPAKVWASSIDGFWRSSDGGRHWQRQDAGLASPSTSWALAFSGGALYGSDQDAVYRWSGRRWIVSSPQGGVVMLDRGPRGRLFASSMGHGVRVLAHGRWERAQGGLLVHDHGALPGIHVVSVTALRHGRAYAGTMDEGAVTSLDGGRSWGQTWPGLAGDGVVWRVLALGRRAAAGSRGSLVAGTDHGILAYSLPPTRPPSALWWVGVAGIAILAPALGISAGAASSRPSPTT